MKPLSLDEARELAPGFVMGTLTPEELAQFEGAMTDPVVSQAIAPELAAHRAAVEFLATERAVTPPADLKGRMLSRIASEPQATAEPTASPDARVLSHAITPTQETSARATPRSVAPTVTPPRAVHVVPQQIGRRPSKASWYATGFMAVALAAAVVFAVDLTNQVKSLQNTVSEKELLLKRSQARLAERDATVNTLTTAGADLVLVQLAPTAPQGPGIQIFWNVKTGTAVVHASGLKPVVPDRTYCLWMIRDGKPVAIKLFNPDADGHRLLNDVEVPRDRQGIAAFAVTEEPAGGSPQPTMTPFLVGAVEAPKP